MDVSALNNITTTYSQSINKAQKSSAKDSSSEKTNTTTAAAIYEKSTTSSSSNIAGYSTIDKLKADTEKRTQQMQSLVEKMFSKQGITFTNSDEMYSILSNGNFNVDPAVQSQAQKDIADDGYWGIEQTSDRLVSFAQALAGGDSTKADELINSIKKGFSKATGTWGSNLPDICQKTLDSTIKKMENWRDGVE